MISSRCWRWSPTRSVSVASRTIFLNQVLYIIKEVVKRPFKVTDRLRQIRKGIVAKSLKDLMKKSVDKLGYDERRDVYLVLEEVRDKLWKFYLPTFRPPYIIIKMTRTERRLMTRSTSSACQTTQHCEYIFTSIALISRLLHSTSGCYFTTRTFGLPWDLNTCKIQSREAPA